jgi:hypothetical protein
MKNNNNSLLFIQLVSAIPIKRQYFQFTFPKLSRQWILTVTRIGCSASGGMGFSSMLNSNFVGIRYFNQSYSSRDGILPTLLGLMKILIRLKFGLKFHLLIKSKLQL